MCFSHLGVLLISVTPLTTENTENKTTPKICKITVLNYVSYSHQSVFLKKFLVLKIHIHNLVVFHV